MNFEELCIQYDHIHFKEGVNPDENKENCKVKEDEKDLYTGLRKFNCLNKENDNLLNYKLKRVISIGGKMEIDEVAVKKDNPREYDYKPSKLLQANSIARNQAVKLLDIPLHELKEKIAQKNEIKKKIEEEKGKIAEDNDVNPATKSKKSY